MWLQQMTMPKADFTFHQARHPAGTVIMRERDSERHEQIRQEAAGWDIPTLLNKAKLTKQGRMTRSALLLLGKDESAHFLAPADTKNRSGAFRLDKDGA
ncbi:MAG: hypothetical protein WCY08_13435 [Rhodocyclaceae bacterium]|jgi:hypothetical protein